MKKSRRTKQKEIIKSEISRLESFFTAEDLYNKIKENNPGIGIATVYRYLKDLRGDKELHSYTCNRRMIYSKDDDNHCHFTCQRCGRVKHFNVDKVDFLKNKIKGEVYHFQIDVHGVCEECLKKEKRE